MPIIKLLLSAAAPVSLRFRLRLSEILRGPGDTYSDVILRLVEFKAAL
jgi:hypothetical protein